MRVSSFTGIAPSNTEPAPQRSTRHAKTNSGGGGASLSSAHSAAAKISFLGLGSQRGTIRQLSPPSK